MNTETNKAEEIVVDTFTRASVRIHWVFLANVVLAGLLLSSVYSSTRAYDRFFMRSAPIHILDAEQKILELEKKYSASGAVPYKRDNAKEPVLLAPVTGWDPNDRKMYGWLVVSQQLAINAMKEMSVGPAAETPLIKYSIPANSLAVICGTTMLVLSMWLFFTMNQVSHMLGQQKTREVVRRYHWAIRNIFMTLHSSEPFLRAFITFLVIFLPSASMLLSTWVIMSHRAQVKDVIYSVFIEEPYWELVFTQWALVGFLLFFAVGIWAAWNGILHKLDGLGAGN